MATFPMALCLVLLTSKDVRISVSSQPCPQWDSSPAWDLQRVPSGLWRLCKIDPRYCLWLAHAGGYSGYSVGAKHIIRLSAIHVNGRLGHFQLGAVMNGALVNTFMNYRESWVNHRAGSGGLAGPESLFLEKSWWFPRACARRPYVGGQISLNCLCHRGLRQHRVCV